MKVKKTSTHSQFYRKKPVVIEAIEFTIDRETVLAIGAWVKPQYKDYTAELRTKWYSEVVLSRTIDIPTLEGVMKANVGDYIIRGIKGEVYPCKRDVFHHTYAQVKVKKPTDTP